MKISIIVANSQNNVIGNNGKIPWHIPDDLRRFKEITTGHHVLMGHNTYKSIGRPLPNRTNIVLTRDRDLEIPGCVVFQDFEDAVVFARNRNEGELFIMGGQRVYEFTLPLAEKIYQTLILQNFDGDIKFPELDEMKWIEKTREEHLGENPPYIFRDLERR